CGDEVPGIQDGRVSGAASWVAPVTARGVAILGARRDAEVDALLVGLDEAGVAVHPEATAGWPGVTFARVTLAAVQATPLGSASPVMALVRILMAAVALGIGRRALEEALVAARATGGADAGEQTVQGLLADAATDLDAARLVTWKAGQGRDVPSLASASSAKLAATAAAQGAVVRATQVVGALSFVRGHVLEQLSQDVRAIELFAGRTEALRSAAAADVLPDIG
ncbi:MAG: hypothetical protein FJW23_15755, partial [Acidimicrobiia bacterium]|nr:hypothetical protein [Acidimicrobiia bacterium]